MRKVATWSIFLLLALSLTAGVAAASGETKPVKCPACGYQFDVDLKG